MRPRCFSWAPYTSTRSSVVSGNPSFFLYLLRIHFMISSYSWVLLSGKTPWNSSQMRQRRAVFRGFAARSLRFLSLSNLDRSFSAKFFMSLKYLMINSVASSSVNPSICSRVSQSIRNLIPASCRAVATTRHFGSSLRPWMISVKTGNLLVGTSSNPSSASKTLDWFWQMKLKNLSLTSSSTSRGRSWSSMASHRSDFISRHLSNKTVWNLGKSSSASCFRVAQSYTIFLQ